MTMATPAIDTPPRAAPCPLGGVIVLLLGASAVAIITTQMPQQGVSVCKEKLEASEAAHLESGADRVVKFIVGPRLEGESEAAIRHDQHDRNPSVMSRELASAPSPGVDAESPAIAGTSRMLQARERWLQGHGYVFFLHSRRSGGTALCSNFANNVRSTGLGSNCMMNKTEAVVGSSCNMAAAGGAKAKKAYHLCKRNLWHAPYSLRRFSTLEALEQEMVSQNLEFVSNEGFPAPEFLYASAQRNLNWTLVTSLREPLDRLVSLLKLRWPDRDKLKAHLFDRKDFSTLVPLDNQFVRLYANKVSANNVTEADYQRAVQVLESHYALVFISEHMAEMLPSLKSWLGLQRLSSERLGQPGTHGTVAHSVSRRYAASREPPVSSARALLNDDPELLARLVETHAFDIRLYEHFKKRSLARMASLLFNVPLQQPIGLPVRQSESG